MTWTQGQPWRVVRSLDRLNTQIRAAYPRAVPPATPASSWGSIADDAHSTSSDHYPHYYAVLGATAVVCARDFPHAPTLGLDAHALADRLRLSRDTRISYVISNRRITGPNHGWAWAPYDGTDPHDTHIHASSVHSTAADNTRDWQIGQAAPAPVKRKAHDMFMIHIAGDARHYLSFGPDRGRVVLTDYNLHMKPLVDAGVPVVTAKDAADLDRLAGHALG